MLAIYKKELSFYFHAVIGWIFIAVNLFFLGMYFSIINVLNGNIYYAASVGYCGFIVMLAVPILTMRVIAEERKSKTDQLILTAPVSVGKIVISKFLALGTILLIPCCVSMTFPLILSRMGTIPMAEAYVAILGYFLYGLAAIAVGIFISSTTDNQIIAAVLSFGALIVLYMIGGLGSVIFSEENLFTKICNKIDFSIRFDEFLQGILDIRPIIYFVSVIVLFLFLTTQLIQKRRWSVSKKSIGLGTYSVSMIVLATAIFVAVNMLSTQIPESFASIDVTPNNLYSLSDETKEYLKNYDTDVTIYVYAAEDDYDETVQKTLNKYVSLSSHIKLVYKNPAKYPNFGTEYTNDSINTGSLIIVGNNRSKIIDYNSLYQQEIDYSTYSSTVTGYDAEGRITGALVSLVSENQPKIYMLNGQNEYELETSFTDTIEKANMTTEELNLLKVDAVPEDATAVMIFGAEGSFSDDDIDKLKAYSDGGGTIFLVTNYISTNNDNLKNFLSGYGVTLYDGLIADNGDGYYYQTPFYLLPEVEASDYTGSNFGFVFSPYAQGFTFDEENENYTIAPILSTSGSAVAKVNPDNSTTYEAEEGDATGSFFIGAEITKTDGSAGSLILFTSPSQFSEAADGMVSGTNLKLFSSIISTFNTSEDIVSIPVKSVESSYIVVPQKYFIAVGVVFVIIVPLGCVIAGVLIWVNRRKK